MLLIKHPLLRYNRSQKNYQNGFKGFIGRLRSYGMPFHNICWSVVGLYISSSSQRTFATGSHNEKQILPKMKQKRFNTRNHSNYTFIIFSWANICISISEKRANWKKKNKCPIFAGLSIEKLTPSTYILAEKGQTMHGYISKRSNP